MSQSDPNTPLTPPPRDTSHLDKPLAHSLAWTGLVKWGSQIITWAFTLIVARILSPEDYGLIAIATLYLGLVTMLSEFGLGLSVVMLRDLEKHQISQVNGLAIMFGITGMAISWTLASPVAGFFFSEAAEANRLIEVIRVLSITFVTSSLRTIPFALLEKDLRFKALALTDAARTLATAGTTLTFAMLGYGYWALVAGMLAETVVASSLGLILRPHPFAWPRLAAIRKVVQTSWHFVVDIISFHIYKSSDQVIAGKLLGASSLGAYALAVQFANIPVDKIAAIVARVTPAFFSAVGDDREALRRYLLSLTRGLALATFPLTVGMALVAEEFVLVALGEKWEAMIVPMQLLAIGSTFRGVYALMPRVLWATGNTRFTMWVSLQTAITLPLGFLAGSYWGLQGIAIAWMVVYPLTQLPVLWLVRKQINLSIREYCLALWPALSSALIMAATVYAVDILLLQNASLLAELVIEVITGGVAYAGAVFIFHRSTVARTVAMVRQLRS